ncbi:MAG: hypothetical protein MZW92_52765 [Comamonadaceae bacterium]|nr:hypothetical protein [Comamonadaceae bacterium]
MRIRALAALLSVILLLAAAATAGAQDRWRVDFENGAAISGYNDVAIPGNTGTRFSMTDDLTSDTEYFWRVRADFRFAPKHVLSGLIAPLTINSSGTFDAPVDFAGTTFAPGVPTDGTLDVQLVSRDLSLRAVAKGHVDVRLRRVRQGPRRRDPARVEREGGRGRPTWASCRSSTSSSSGGWARARRSCWRATPSPRRRAAPRTSSRASSSTPASSGPSRPATGSSKAAPTTTRSTPSRRCTTSPPASSCVSRTTGSNGGTPAFSRGEPGVPQVRPTMLMRPHEAPLRGRR